MSADLLRHALERAGITATVQATRGEPTTIALVCDTAAAADLAERVLRTVPLRGNAADPWPGEPVGGPAVLQTSRVVLDTDPDHPAVMAALASATPRVTEDLSLAVVPVVRDTPTPAQQEARAASCTCMASVLTCTVHHPGPVTTPSTPTLPAGAYLATDEPTVDLPPAPRGDDGITITGGT